MMLQKPIGSFMSYKYKDYTIRDVFSSGQDANNNPLKEAISTIAPSYFYCPATNMSGPTVCIPS